jgi:peroxin-3
VSLATGGLQDSAVISLENHDDDNPDQAYGNDFETNRRYLTFSWWLLHRGWKDVMLNVKQAVEEVFGPLSPRDDITLERFSILTLEVRKRVEGVTEADRNAKRWLPYLLPPRDQEEFVLQQSGTAAEPVTTGLSYSGKSPLRRLLDETSDLIDSPPFTHVLTLLLDAGFSTLVENKVAQQSFKITVPSADPSMGPRVQEIVEPKPVKLPIVLATLTRQAHQIGNGVPNEYLQSMEQVRDLEAFAAVVYSSNWESEIMPLEEDKPAREARGRSSKDVEKSAVDIGRSDTFESAWGKATTSSDSGGIFERP